MPQLLSRTDFKIVVQLAPLVSIDLIIRDPEGKVLLGRRNNEPAKGHYFVPGGRILKDERIRDAFARILKTEVDVEASFANAKFLGAYEHFYETNFVNEPGYSLYHFGPRTKHNRPRQRANGSAAQRLRLVARKRPAYIGSSPRKYQDLLQTY